ncbi:MAG TPA: cupredoxin domain-containing protein [Candidatus Limnocylindrales bacterium]|nr:cupredoxin domain-containing protein [Candidatus Limnocylindrales bacterium]
MHHVTRTSLLTLAAAAALGLAACGSNNSLPTVPPASAAPPAAVDPTPVGGSEAPGLVITARNIAFEPQSVTVPANVPLTLVLDNQDSGVPHDIQVSDANGNVIVKSEIINGPRQLQVALPALAPGDYPFICVVHPNMVGTITAE